MRKKISIMLSLFFILSFMLSIIPSDINIAHAEESSEEEEEGLGKENLDSGTATRSGLADDDEKFYYRLEAGMPSKDKSKWYNLPGKTADAVSTAINETIMLFNKIVFWINTQVGKVAIGTLEKANNFAFIDKAINKITSHVKSLVGISGTSFSSTGMFSPLIKIIALVVVIYAFYQLIWKRSFIASFGEMLKFIIVLTTALLLFGNYSSFLSGMNNLSNEVGGLIVGSSGTTTASAQESRVLTFTESLWGHFVDKPYLTLQYGTDNLDDLATENTDGIERVKQLLTARTGSDTRSDIVDYEINDRENYYMTYDSVIEKTSLNMMFLMLNILTSIPVLIIALAIIFTQFWFVIIALIAPFALLIASFPTQFNVLKRYFFELSLPLIIKIGLHFVLVIIMVLTSILADVEQELHSDMFSGHIGTAYINAVFYIMLFFGIFILRKRITGLLSSGSDMMGEIREGMSGVTTKPIQKGIQTGATVAGAGIGLATGGPAGMAMGANVGGTIGKVASGGSDGVAGATQDIGRVAYQHQMMKHIGGKGKQSASGDEDVADLTPEQARAEEEQKLDHEEKVEGGINNFKEFANDQNMSDKERDQTAKAMNDKDVDFSKLSKETLNRANIQGEGFGHFNNFINAHDLSANETSELQHAMLSEGVDINKLTPNSLDRANSEGMGMDNPQVFARNLRQNQLKEHARINSIKGRRIDGFNQFLSNHNLSENEVQGIHKHLMDNSIDVGHIPTSEYTSIGQNIQGRIDQGESLDFATEFREELGKTTERRIPANPISDPNEFAENIKTQQANESLRKERMKTQRAEDFNTFLGSQNLNQSETQSIKQHLDDKAIDVSTMPKTDYIKADEAIRERLQGGESLSYTEELKQELSQRAVDRRNTKEKDRVFGNRLL